MRKPSRRWSLAAATLVIAVTPLAPSWAISSAIPRASTLAVIRWPV